MFTHRIINKEVKINEYGGMCNKCFNRIELGEMILTYRGTSYKPAIDSMMRVKPQAFGLFTTTDVVICPKCNQTINFLEILNWKEVVDIHVN